MTRNAQALPVVFGLLESGTEVDEEPSSSSDRTCVDCASGTYSEFENQLSCLALEACPAGTVQTAPGTAMSQPSCADCEVGQFCEGGTAPELDCTGGEWDHDQNPGTACQAWTDCGAGSRVDEPGDATSDRTCAPCESGEYSEGDNAESCSAWTVCGPGTRVLFGGSESADRTCDECADGSFTDTDNAGSGLRFGHLGSRRGSGEPVRGLDHLPAGSVRHRRLGGEQSCVRGVPERQLFDDYERSQLYGQDQLRGRLVRERRWRRGGEPDLLGLRQFVLDGAKCSELHGVVHVFGRRRRRRNGHVRPRVPRARAAGYGWRGRHARLCSSRRWYRHVLG